MIVLERSYDEYRASLQRHAEASRAYSLAFFVAGAAISALAATLEQISISNFQSMFQLAVALNLAIASLDQLVPADMEQYRQELRDAKIDFETKRDDAEHDFHGLESPILSDLDSGKMSVDEANDKLAALGGKYHSRVDDMVRAANMVEDTYRAQEIHAAYEKLLSSYQSNPIKDMLSYRRGRMALVASGVSFAGLIITTLFPTLFNIDVKLLKVSIEAFTGGFAVFSYTLIFLTLHNAHIMMRWRNELPDVAVGMVLRKRR
ncbi:hypothetical protein [Azospirillum argentinense]